MRIRLTSVLVDDPMKAHKFYTEKLGFVSRVFLPEAKLAIVVSPEESHGTGLLLEPNTNQGARDFQKGIYDAGLPVIIFGVDDISREYEKLKAFGVVFRKEPTKTEFGTETLFEDTCGNLIQLHQV